MAYALGLPDALRRRGLVVEVVPGWETRSAGSLNAKGAVCHWTAGPANSKTRPSMNICVNGRPGLPGPLCNVYLDRNGVAVVVAAGRANHAGAGGWKGLTGNSAVFGTEAEAAGSGDFTAAQRAAYPKLNAAYCDLGGFGADMVCGHSEWAGARKTDINGYTMDEMRAQVAALLSGEPSEDDMQADEREALFYLKGLMSWGFDPTLGKGAAFSQPGEINAKIGAMHALLMGQGSAITALSGLVAKQNGLSLDDVERVVTKAVDQAVARGVDVDVTVNGTAA